MGQMTSCFRFGFRKNENFESGRLSKSHMCYARPVYAYFVSSDVYAMRLGRIGEPSVEGIKFFLLFIFRHVIREQPCPYR